MVVVSLKKIHIKYIINLIKESLTFERNKDLIQLEILNSLQKSVWNDLVKNADREKLLDEIEKLLQNPGYK